jgi:hypothetical protein
MARFSSRLSGHALRNRLTLALERRRAAGAALLDLTQSNPTRVGLAYPDENLRRALGDAAVLAYEPVPRGAAEARREVAGWLSRRGHAVDPERLLLTTGTSEAYSYLFHLLLEPGDTLLVPRPSYPLLDSLARLASIRLRPYPLRFESRWRLDFGSLRRAAGKKARAAVVVHPNNPTGSFLEAGELQELRELCRARDLALISDEVFAEYAFEADARRPATLAEDGDTLTFTLGGLSKAAGLPQMKLGWIQVNGPEAACRQALDRLELAADTFLSVGSPVQGAAGRLLAEGDGIRARIFERLRSNLEHLRAAVSGAPSCVLLGPEGGWTAPLRLPATRTDEEWALVLLQEDGVLVQPGYFYDFTEEAVLVLSLLPEPAEFRAGVARILARACTG